MRMLVALFVLCGCCITMACQTWGAPNGILTAGPDANG